MEAESSTAGRKRAGRVVLSESEDDGESARSSPAKANGSARKRAKSTRRQVEESEDEEDNESMENGNDEESGEEIEAPAPPRQVGNKPAYQRDPKDKFVSGAIVRMKFVNFITYDHVEFRPGPYLNMIMGPNGTGKSSIAAGIAIGLAFPPKVMGRVNDLRSYVKMGTEEAMTEIELKGRPGKPNPVIRRVFWSTSDRSDFKLNGHPCSRDVVMKLVASFDIQSNNLCSFLPQDKVAEFAKMAPDVVLRETMRAAGDSRLTDWHNSLKEKGVKRESLAITLRDGQAEEERLTREVKRLEPDVERLEDRERLEFQKGVLEVERIIADYNRTKAEHSAGLQKRKELRAKLNVAKDKRQPLQDLATKWSNKASKAVAVGNKVADDIKQHRRSYDPSDNALKRSTDRTKDIDRKLSVIEKTAKQRVADHQTFQRQIAQYKRVLEEPLEEGHEARGERLREMRPRCTKEANDASEAYESAKSTVDAFDTETGKINLAIDRMATQHDRVSSVDSQREIDARAFNPSLSFLLDWLKKNGASLESEIGLPPMMSVNVPDKRYAWQVEMCTNLSQRLTFVCTSKKDYDRLLELQGKIVHNVEVPNIRDNGTRRIPELKLQLHLAYVELREETLNPPKPHSPPKLRDYGLECYAIDKVEASPPIIAFLNTRVRLNQIPLTQRPSSEIDIERINHELRLLTVITGDSHYHSTRSAYGRKDFQSTTRTKENPKAFATTVNTAALARIDEELKTLRLEKQEREAPASKAKRDLQAAEERRDAARKKLEENTAAIKQWQESNRKHRTARGQLEIAEERLRELEALPSVDAERSDLQKQKYDLLKKEVGHLREVWELGPGALDLADAAVTNAINVAVAEQNHHMIEDHQNERDKAFRELEGVIADLSKRLDEYQARCAQLKREVTARTSGQPPDFAAAVNARNKTNKTPEEVDREIIEINAQLDMAANIDPGILRRYENFKETLKKVSKEVEKNAADLGKVKAEINKILSDFDPALDQLVAVVSDKFSKAFANLNCSGEVRMARTEDFAKWGIEIMVSYRDDQGLELLTGSRQSGGERSLATITYLMSLSEMARTPFSLVDEINQGMDSRAERAVFNQLVETTCRNSAGQYFLITPKLLVGLKYHELMKVLFVENGGGLPAPVSANQGSGRKRLRWGDFSGCLQVAKRARGGAGSVTAH